MVLSMSFRFETNYMASNKIVDCTVSTRVTLIRGWYETKYNSNWYYPLNWFNWDSNPGSTET